MNKPNCHLCLVSDQPTPNITPALDRSFQPKKVILLVSPEKQQQAHQIAEVLRSAGIQVSQRQLHDAMDIEHIRERVLEILSENADGIALNATGGTKPMSIAAYEVFRGLELPIFYVHPEKDRVIWMYPPAMQSFDIEDRIGLSQFLQSHGIRCESLQRKTLSRHRQQLTHRLIHGRARFAKAFGTLNYMVSEAEKTLKTDIAKDKSGWRNLSTLIDLFEEQGLLRHTGNEISFDSEEDRFFVNGGWLEQHVFSMIQRIRISRNSHIHDLAQGIRVSRNRVENEIDVAFLCDNRLHLVECKTGQLTGRKYVAANILYKLEALTDTLGGLRARAMLVSYQTLRKADRNRARQADIHICDGQGIQQLESTIRYWIT